MPHADSRGEALVGASLTVARVAPGDRSDIVVTLSAPAADYDAALSRPRHVCGQALHLRARDVVTVERCGDEVTLKAPCGCLYLVHELAALPSKGRPIPSPAPDAPAG
jgi:hypothetical protein